MLKTQLRHIDKLDTLIQKLDEEIKRRMHPFEEDLSGWIRSPEWKGVPLNKYWQKPAQI
jgi:hypothetical protein